MGGVIVNVNSTNTEIGVKLLNQDATLFDLLEAWQLVCDDRNLDRRYGDRLNLCRGCLSNCCNTAYVIPDLISFKSIAQAKGLSYFKFLKDYFSPGKLKLGLAMLKFNPCIFLHNGSCTIYPLRTLLCRFYLCTDLPGSIEQLIYYISGIGMTATQVYLQTAGMLDSDKSAGCSSFDKMFFNLIEEYQQDSNIELFLQAHSYREIPLKPLIDGSTRKGLLMHNR
ncbi:MAG: YkgJ family cysteine cluster protein [Syntrophomonadaceae bacterium]|jgi:Fe-S-cluster containining protein|nr:YkgJ family cysteine cluster protein [Syntrophomonadaceae bacterium]